MKEIYQKPEMDVLSITNEGVFAASPYNDDDIVIGDGGEALGIFE